MMTRQVLSHGQTLACADGEEVWQIEQGRVEVYIFMAGEELEYQQIFLLEAGSGDFIFGLPAGVDSVRLMAVANGEVVLRVFPRADFQNRAAELRSMLSRWFNQVAKVRWLAELIKFQDDVVLAWVKADIFGECDGAVAAQLWEKFDDYQDILSILAEGQFAAQRGNRFRQLQNKKRLREKLALAGSASLLSQKDLKIHVQTDYAGGSSVAFLVKLVADFLHMPVEPVVLPPDAARITELSLLRQLIKKAGMQIRLVKLKKDWFQGDSGVLLGYLGPKKELVAMLPEKNEKYRLYGEQYPAGVLIDSELAGQLSEDAFVCYAGLYEPVVTTRNLIGFMLKRCWAADWWIIFGTSLAAGLIPLLTPLITESIFSNIVPINDRQALGTMTQMLLIAAFAMAAVNYTRSIAVMRVKSHINMAAEAALWSRLLSLPAAFFRKYQAGDLVQRMAGIGAITETATGTAVTAVFNLLFSFGSLGLMAYYSGKLTLAAIGFWLVYLAVSAVIYWKALYCRRKIAELSGLVAGRVLQVFYGLSKFRMTGGEERAFYLWSKLFGEEWQWNLKTRQQTNYMGVVNGVQPLLLSMIMYFLAMEWLRNADGSMTISYAEFLGFITAMNNFNLVLTSFIPMAAALSEIPVQLERLRPVLSCEPESLSDKADMPEIRGHIEFSEISFRYRPDGPLVLAGVSFHIAAGETVALVGNSGCGKSTIIRLLLGFEKPEQGEILIDGQDIAEYNMASVRSQLGVVLQNGQLLSGDIFSNIVGTLPLTLDDAWKVAEMVGLAADIRAMPMGMHTVISEGATNISGGQRQRILIARALVHKPRVVIMDEATSALDNTTQAIVTASVGQLQATRLIIAHRLSTIREADTILVMDKGKIVEQGSFTELMTRQGLFARLAERQLV